MNTVYNTRTNKHTRSHTLRIGINALSLSIALALGLAPVSSWAQESPVSISIAAQPLGDALLQLGQQTALQIFFSQEVAAGLNSRPVSGNLEAEQALRQLLEGTGLRYVRDGNNITLSRAADGDTVTLAPVRVTGNLLVAITEGTGSYAATGASILKGAQSLKEIPQTVSVITRQRMDDQNLTSVRDAMEQAPGIYVNSFRSVYGSPNNSANYYSRGFEIENYMIDGVTSNAADPTFQVNTGLGGSSAIYDRVEVLRGVAGLLVGNGNPGGTVNLARKRPTKEFQQIYTLGAGSWNNYRGEVDLSGPLVESGALRGRMVAAYNSRDRFWAHTDSKSPLLYGILEADLTSATRISLGVRHEKYNENASKQGNFFDAPSFVPGRKDNYSPTWGYIDTKDTELFLNLNHQFSDRWELALASYYLDSEMEAVLPMTFGLRSNLQTRKVENKTYSVDANLLGFFDAFGREHKVTFGFNASKQDIDSRLGYSSNLADINLSNNWNWPYDQSMRDLVDFTFSDIPEQFNSKSHGIFGKLDFKLTDKLTAIIGGRISWYEYEYSDWNGNYRHERGGRVSNEFTPYAALIYALTPEWSAYVSYAEIFKPQWGMYTRSGDLIDHEKGKNYELGIKGELLDGRLNTAFAIYQIDKGNTARLEVPPFDSVCPGNPTGRACYVATGQTRTQGFDAEINGELLPGWKIGAGYTYTDSEIRKADRYKGYAPSFTPKHMLKMFSSYTLNDRLTLGGGVQVQSRESDIQNPADWPLLSQSGYAIYNAFSRYKVNENIDVSLNVSNLFDKKYWANGSSVYRNGYGEPRNYMLTLRAKF